jgi:hypothetical protein
VQAIRYVNGVEPSIHQIHSKPEYQVQNKYSAIGGAAVEDPFEPPEEAASLLWWPLWTGFSSVAQRAGVKTSATITDSPIAVAMVIENCR